MSYVHKDSKETEKSLVNDLKANQNEIDTWFKHIEWTFVREGEEMNIVFFFMMKSGSFSDKFLLSLLMEDMRNKSFVIVHYNNLYND